MKTYTVQDLSIVDAVSAIRRNAAMYLGGPERATGAFLADRMMWTLIWLDALPAEVARHESWWRVSSRPDWLTREGAPNVDMAFSRIIPFPEAGVNSFRGEILLSAFADAVVTSTADGTRWIRDDGGKVALPDGLNLSRVDVGRIVAFRLDETA